MLKFFEGLIRPYPAEPTAAPPKGFIAFLWACSEGIRGYILLMTVLTAMIAAFEATLYAVLGRMVDSLSNTPLHLWWTHHQTSLLTVAGIVLCSPLVVWLQTLVKHQTLAGNFPMRLRWNFHRHMLDQSMAFYQDEFAGRVATKVMQTALAVRDCWLIVADIMVFVSVYFITMASVLGGFGWAVLVPFAVWVSLYALVLRWFVPQLARVGKSQADARSLMVGRITDAYTNITTVKLFSHGRREADYARGAMSEFMQTVHAQMRLISWVQLCIHILSMLLILSSAGMALWWWSKGQVGAGAVAAVTAMALRLNGISHWIMWEFAALFEHIGTVQDGITTLSSTHSVVDAPQAQALQVRQADIRFEDVSFYYPSKAPSGDAIEPEQKLRPVLKNVSLHIKAGEKIGLVGRSGAGKSTLVNLLLRFYDLQHGCIRVNGQNIAQVTQNSLRVAVGMVTQDTSLLHRSVRDNIVYGRPNATEAEMQAASQRAQAHDFILQLTDAMGRKGYDAHVGERGVKLSGGQRQRIAIARVMLKDAPILLLDEATSALDSEVESVIQDSLYRLMEGKTVVAIAHRLSTIAAMDRLVVMDQGEIVEEGTHAQLLAKGGLYARLWSHQSGGFIGEEVG